jgi:hypothetical protein
MFVFTVPVGNIDNRVSGVEFCGTFKILTLFFLRNPNWSNKSQFSSFFITPFPILKTFDKFCHFFSISQFKILIWSTRAFYLNCLLSNIDKLDKFHTMARTLLFNLNEINMRP